MPGGGFKAGKCPLRGQLTRKLHLVAKREKAWVAKTQLEDFALSAMEKGGFVAKTI